MRVLNVHERALSANLSAAGALIDALASSGDRLWPHERWPRMRFADGLGIGARGGHGPIRYTIVDVVPGRSIRFRFDAPKGFDGFHAFSAVAASDAETILRHTLEMRVGLATWLKWAAVYRPLHDALIEDALDKAVRALGGTAPLRPFSRWVGAMRWLIRRLGTVGR